jgi:hypothetical protein
MLILDDAELEPSVKFPQFPESVLCG